MSLLDREPCATIHGQALRVLAEHGVQVESPELAARLTAVGAQVSGDRVRFPAREVERRLEAAERRPLAFDRPRFTAHVGVYQSRFLDPETDRLAPFDELRLAQYAAFARTFPAIRHIGLLGLPFVPAEWPGNPQPLLERLYAWKFDYAPEGTIQATAYCAPVLELCRCHADATGRPLREVFSACGFLVSPLRLARPEAEQLLWFAEHGLEMRIGAMPSLAGTAPISMAGAATLMLAEQMFLFLLRQALFGANRWRLGVGCCTLDLRNGAACYGRPEQYRLTLAMADLARFYGCECGGHSGLSDARRPSTEAGAQKAMGLMATALAVGSADASAGLLAMDEVCSPVQLVLDLDLVAALEALYAPARVDEQECAAAEIMAVGPGGNHLGTDFTVERLRRDLCYPCTWSAGLLAQWESTGRRLDVDAARERWRQFAAAFQPQSAIAPDEEQELRRILRAHRLPE